MKTRGPIIFISIKSFKDAYNGIKILLKEEINSRIHLLAAVCVLIAGGVFRISAYEWLAVIISIGLVFALEILNTAVEALADFVSPDFQNQIKKVKDLSAAGVLVGAFTALIVGLIVFIPYLMIL